jgi:hypothetical protein
MKDFIAQTLRRPDPSIAELIACCEAVKEEGGILVIKFDGERPSGQYTTFISVPGDLEHSTIRSDGDDLKACLSNILQRYLSQKVE